MNKQFTSTVLAAIALAVVGATWTLPAKAQQDSQITSQTNPNGYYCEFDDDGYWECYED